MIPEHQELDENFNLFVTPKMTTSMLLSLKDDTFKWDIIAKVAEAKTLEYNSVMITKAPSTRFISKVPSKNSLFDGDY